MCGIAGWINTKTDLSGKKDIIEDMTYTLRFRGPDASAVHVSKNALLGHRRLIVVDPEGGAQPMPKTIGDRTYTIVYNGELYNTEDIRKVLKGKGYRFNSYSDTEVLLTSYIEWGPGCVDYLNGIYAFGIWSECDKSLFIARDRLGVKPLFYTQAGDSFMFASEIKALMAHPDINPEIDDQGLMEIFGLGPARSPGSGVFRNINEVKPGYCILVTPSGLREKRYWQLESKKHTEDLKTTTAHIKYLVMDAIERQLVSDVPVCTFLSGGLDSSAISAVTARLFKKEGKGTLKTYSIDYAENDLYFKASEFQPDSDGIWSRRMSDYIGSEHYNIVLDIPDLAAALDDAVRANDLPGMADVDASLYLFCKEIRKNATVALSGECADEIFGGYPWYRRPEAINAGTFPWSRAIDQRLDILSPELKRLPVRDYINYRYEETLKEVPFLEDESSEDSRMREIFYLNLKWFMITLLNRKDRMSMSNGLEVRVPFADHRIVEYTWNIPIDMKFTGNREKGLLRRALTGMLPPGILRRKKSPYPKTHHPQYTRMVIARMKDILADPASPILDLINIAKVSDIVATGGAGIKEPWFGQLMTGPQMIAYLIQVNTWLKQYNVRINSI